MRVNEFAIRWIRCRKLSLVFGPAALLAALTAGCLRSVPSGEPELVWGRRGISAGRLQKPRAMAIDGQDQLYIVDMTGRVQVFTCDGHYLRGWRTPEIAQGKPSGLTFDRAGNLMVADTHYYRVLFYTPHGDLLKQRTLGGVSGHGPGEFNFVTDAVEDADGSFYVAEYGDCDRIQKFAADGQFVMQWGGRGRAPGQFNRPNSLAIDDRNRIWVADACNHRIQVFAVRDDRADLVMTWGEQGRGPGQLYYPYDLVLDGRGHVYVIEFGNHRVQKLTLQGEPIASWGVPGRRAGELSCPWALVLDSRQRVHVLDTYNHRVQRLRL